MYNQKKLTFLAKYFIIFLQDNKRCYIFAVSKLTISEKHI